MASNQAEVKVKPLKLTMTKSDLMLLWLAEWKSCPLMVEITGKGRLKRKVSPLVDWLCIA